MSEPVRPPADPPPPEITFGDLTRVVWNRLREMRTVFQLLVLIAAGALICAIVPQNSKPEAYTASYGQFLGNVIVRLGLDHVHSATWFLLLLAILLLSLVACSGRLWREAWVRWRVPSVDAAAQRMAGAKALSATAPFGLDEAMGKLRGPIHHRHYRTVELARDGQRQLLYLHRHRFSAWGQALAHYSVFLIALGSVMGTVPGLSLDQNVDIEEGQSYAGQPGELPFAVHVDKFYITQDLTDGSVKNYFSEVRLLSGDKAVSKATISVNRPLKYQGYFITQVSWGLGQALVEVTRNGKTERLAYPLARVACPDLDEGCSVWGVPEQGGAAFLADRHMAFVVNGFFADARRDGKGIAGSPSEYPGHPAINLMLVGNLPGMQKPAGPASGPPKHSMKQLGWLFAGEKLPFEGGEVKFVGITKTTGLGIRRDFGLPLVWAGFIASMVGLALIFYFPLQRRVVALEAQGSGATLLTAASYGRSSELSEDMQSLWSDLVAAVGGQPVARTDAEADLGKGAARD